MLMPINVLQTLFLIDKLSEVEINGWKSRYECFYKGS